MSATNLTCLVFVILVVVILARLACCSGRKTFFPTHFAIKLELYTQCRRFKSFDAKNSFAQIEKRIKIQR